MNIKNYLFKKLQIISRNCSQVSIPKYHKEFKDFKDFDYDKIELNFGFLSDYEVIKKVGHGKQSEVFQAIDLFNDERVMIKILKHSDSKQSYRLKRECYVLDLIKNCPNVINIRDVLKCSLTDTFSIVQSNQYEDYPFIHQYRNIDVKSKEDTERLKSQMKRIIEALVRIHAINVIHRDIKPTNILVSDEDPKQLKIIDWGMGEVQQPHKSFNLRVASRNFKAPELLFGVRQQHYALDVWAAGAMFAGIILGRDPFFEGKTNPEIAKQLVKLFGTKSIIEQLHKQQVMDVVSENPDLKFVFEENQSPKGLLEFQLQSAEMDQLPDDVPFKEDIAIDLLQKMLVLDQDERIGFNEVLKHEFFQDVE